MSLASPASTTTELQLQFWNSRDAVGQYSRPAFLFPSELPLLGLLRDRWAQVRMLDVGVGAGRTSLYLAELCGSYVGIDFASEMIEVCKKRFHGRWPGAEFAVGDASDLKGHEDNAYDLVLFSFNGIDCMPHEQRLRALAELKRVCKPGGYVVFSSHNAYRIPVTRQFEFQRHPVRLLEEVRRWWRVRSRNLPLQEALSRTHIEYCDGNIGVNRHMFVRPEAQVVELKQLGLEVLALFASDGRPLPREEDPKDTSIPWVYYYCRKPQA